MLDLKSELADLKELKLTLLKLSNSLLTTVLKWLYPAIDKLSATIDQKIVGFHTKLVSCFAHYRALFILCRLCLVWWIVLVLDWSYAGTGRWMWFYRTIAYILSGRDRHAIILLGRCRKRLLITALVGSKFRMMPFLGQQASGTYIGTKESSSAIRLLLQSHLIWNTGESNPNVSSREGCGGKELVIYLVCSIAGWLVQFAYFARNL